MQYYPVITVKNNKFPFGFVDNQIFTTYSKILVRNKIQTKTQIQYDSVVQKLNIIRHVFHQNIINLQSIQEKQRGQIVLFYRYVHYKLSYKQNVSPSILKLFHQQLIKMVVYLAKNSIITSFNKDNCGFKIIHGKKIIKYFISLSEISISSERSVIQRSVQLFTVQSLQYFDQIMLHRSRQIEQTQKLNLQYRKLSLAQKHKIDQQDYTDRNRNKSLVNKIKNKIFSQRKIHLSELNKCKLVKSIIRTINPSTTDVGSQNNSHSNKTIQSKTQNAELEKNKSLSRQKSAKTDYSSLQKYFKLKPALKDRINELKQRSQKALLKMNHLKLQLARRSTKIRRYTETINTTCRLIDSKDLKHLLRKS